MEDIGLVLDLVLAFGAALVGGFVAQRIGLPVLIGYVLAGVLIGPNTPGLSADFERVQLLANLGVAFLMFALGVELSFAELQRMRRVATVGGAIQLTLTFGLGAAAAIVLDWSLPAAFLLGGAFAISSSLVAIKLFLGRGEGSSTQARAALSLGVVQDLSLVPMLALLPLLAGTEDNLAVSLARSLGVAIVALGAVVVLGTRVVPRILFLVAGTGSRELFLLSVVVIALGTAVASHAAGLSLALGAFLAGLVVSESEFDSQVLTEIIPLRDLFATLFFVALGMLIEPRILAGQAGLILALVAVLVVGKFVIGTAAFLIGGLEPRTATLAAIGMAQIGEFSFVLAGAGLGFGIITRSQYGLVLEVALGSILVAPLLMRFGPALATVVSRLPGIQERTASQIGAEPASAELSRHVVICGFGRVGSELGVALERRGLRYAVIEINPAVVRDLREAGVVAYYGDSGAAPLLLRAGVRRARTLAVTVSDLVSAQAAVRIARELNPTIDIVTRATDADVVEILRRAGAGEVVQPEFEAGLEFVRHVLRRQGVSARETELVITRRRTTFYEGMEADER
ncbi:MAG: cation:proton antiporter [Chloroflexota bacterium]|nr:cation:proton antiporter [Chloroflexota bacterium]